MEVTRVERIFEYKNNGTTVRLADPNESMSADQVLKFYSTQYPSMNNAKITKGKLEGIEQKYLIETVVGTKG